MFLGRAEPSFREQDLGKIGGFPEYDLDFRVPSVKAGHYAFVIYCGGCNPGPRGALIADPSPKWLFQVRRGDPIASISDRTGATRWIVAAAGLFIVGLGGSLLIGRRRSRDRIFS